MASDERFGKHDLEDDYFRKQDRELIEKMRKAAAADEAQRALGAKSGIEDPDVLREIARLGFSPDTVILLPLMPVLQVAWAEGGISPAERALILEFARHRGVAEGSAADQQLAEWLAHSPAPDVFSRASRLIAAMLAAGSGPARDLSVDDLVHYCESIAAASGGILGLGKVSAGERAAIEQIQQALKSR
jgi:tellurite resistance protein